VLGTWLAGLVAAIVLVLTRPGLGWLITGLAVAGVATGTAWSSGVHRIRPGQAAWGLAMLALLAVGGVRAAGWLFAYCVIGALITGALALAGGRTVRGLAVGAVAGPVAAARSLPWAVRGVARVRVASRPGGPRVGLAVLVSVALVAVFGALFASADAAFARLVTVSLPPVDNVGVARSIFCFALIALIASGAAFLAAARSGLDRLPPTVPRLVSRLEWALPLAALDVLFLAFESVQVSAVFGGHTEGLDYAHHARSGFFQLVVVTLLALVVIGVAARVAPRREVADRRLLRLLLGALDVLTLGVVASAITRLVRYEEAYGFTRLRVLVGAVELWLGLLFLLVLVAGVRLRAGWLPQAVAGTAVAGLLAVAALNPDGFIAARNVDRYLQTRDIDVWYLSTLSADAAPALDRLPAQLRSCALSRIAENLHAQDDDWRTWNLGRSRARAVIASGGPVSYCHEY
jgi:hypothetical protein